MYYDKQGNEIDAMTWVKFFEDEDYKRVALDEVGDVKISTVWLGLDHNLVGEGDKLIFETLVFGEDGDENYMERYSTLEEAEEGHKRIVEQYERSKI